MSKVTNLSKNLNDFFNKRADSLVYRLMWVLLKGKGS